MQVATPEDETALTEAQLILDRLVAGAPMQKRPKPPPKPRAKAQVGPAASSCVRLLLCPRCGASQ